MKNEKKPSMNNKINFCIKEGFEKKGGLNNKVPPKPSTPPPAQKPNNKSK